MPLAFEPGDLAGIQRYLERSDPNRRLVPCEIDSILLGPDAITSLSAAVTDAVTGRGRHDQPRVCLLTDATPIWRDGEDVKRAIEERLGGELALRVGVLSDGHPELHASSAVVDQAVSLIKDVDLVVTVGGGTVTDIGKLATHQVGTGKLVVVQTAASVDGFTDNVSVVLRDGVKRTVPSRWPSVVLADTTLISQAPAAMNRAGYGEILSMFTAPADWRLSFLLGVDGSFDVAATDLLAAVGDGIEDWSAGVATGVPAAVERATWALSVRGIVTGIAGTTACLSGVEHLFSHMLDLYHGQRGEPIGLHGAQVGAATLLAAAAWEMLFERAAAAGEALARRWRLPDPSTARRWVDAAFADVEPSGRVASECWRDYERKLATWGSATSTVTAALADWPRTQAQLRPMVRNSADLARALSAASAVWRLDQLVPAVSPDLARWALANSGLMRNRTTVVDLLTFLGWWGPEDVAEVISRALAACPPGVLR